MNDYSFVRTQSAGNFVKENQKYVKRVVDVKRSHIKSPVKMKSNKNFNSPKEKDEIHIGMKLKVISETGAFPIQEAPANPIQKFKVDLNHPIYRPDAKFKIRQNMEESQSFLDLSQEIPMDKEIAKDIFTFNSRRRSENIIDNNEELKREDHKLFKVYRSTELKNKRNRIIEDNCLFCVSFSRNQNFTYSDNNIKKIFSSSFNDILKNKEDSIVYRKKPTRIKRSDQSKVHDVETVEDLHFIFVKFYQKNKETHGKEEKSLSKMKSVTQCEEQDID